MSRAFKNKPRPQVLIELRPSVISGLGVFAVRILRKGQKVAEGLYTGDFKTLIPWGQLKKLDGAVQKKVETFCIGTPKGFVPPEGHNFDKLTIEWYFNHSCSGNVGFNGKGDFVAVEEIAKDDELTYDYGIAESNPRFRMVCKCRSRICRGIITGDDWKKENLKTEKGPYMLPQLRRLIHST